MSNWKKGSRSAGWWVSALAGLALVAAYLGGHLTHGGLDGRSAYFALAMTVGILVGLWAWAWRPKTHMGPLMFWWPALWLVSDLPAAFPDSSVASTIGVALFVIGPIVFAQTALSYPTGRLLPGRLAWIYVFILGYAAQIIQNAVNLLYLDLSACPVCPPPRVPTLFHIASEPPFSLETWNRSWLVFVMAILPIGLYLLYRTYKRASPAGRRSLGPVIVTATFVTVTSWITGYVFLTDRFSLLTPISWIQTTGALAAALTALLGLVVTRRARFGRRPRRRARPGGPGWRASGARAGDRRCDATTRAVAAGARRLGRRGWARARSSGRARPGCDDGR